MEPSGTEAQVFIGLVLTGVFKFTVSWWLRRYRDQKFEKVGCVSALYIYPVKSCKSFSLTEGECTQYGIKSNGVFDRSFMVVQSNRIFAHQRIYPKMALISCHIEGDNLVLTAPGKSPISVSRHSRIDEKNVKTYEVHDGETIQGQDCGDAVGEWLSKFLGLEGLRLVQYVDGMKHRDIHHIGSFKGWEVASAEGDTAMYADWAPYLVINQRSLDDLNTRLEKPLTEMSFRPNILIDCKQAFEEDDWLEIRIGDKIRMRCTDACTRCSLTTVDPNTGVKSKDGEPLKTLRKFRCFDKFKDSPIFGINTTPDVLGMIKVGDPVYAIKKNKK